MEDFKVLQVDITFVPFKFGFKEKLLARRYFPKLDILRTKDATENDMIWAVRERIKNDFWVKLTERLTEAKNKFEIEDYKIANLERTIHIEMLGTEDEVSIWKDSWKKELNKFSQKWTFKLMKIKIETKVIDDVRTRQEEQRDAVSGTIPTNATT